MFKFYFQQKLTITLGNIYYAIFTSVMEMSFLILSGLLILVALLALFDGLYLHLIRYQLQNQADSRLEHLTHTVRAIFFPIILYLLFLNHNQAISFITGSLVVFLDIVALGIDAFSEKDSRAFMGGLPRWEYILHLFVNGFHFALIAVFLAVKINISDYEFTLVSDFNQVLNFKYFEKIVRLVLPGSILFAIVHILLAIPNINNYWNNKFVNKI